MTLMKSPVGEIQFLAVENPVKSTSGKEVYTVKLAFDVKKDKEWLAQISEINDAKVVTAQTYRGKSEAVKAILAQGKALVGADSKFQPETFDSAGTPLEENPRFFADSSGTAQMIVQPYQSDKGGTINLLGVVIHTIENAEGSSSGTDRETRLVQLREMAKPTS